VERRTFIQLLAFTASATTLDGLPSLASNPPAPGAYHATPIVNEYSALLPGENAALATPPAILAADSTGVHLKGHVHLPVGDDVEGWRLLTVTEINGMITAIFEKHVTHRGAIAFVTPDLGTIALIPKGIGDLANIRPRPIAAPAAVQFKRPPHYEPGPDIPGNYILNSEDDPSYETVAGMGPEFIGWSLVANETGGPMQSLFLEPDGTSRELNSNPPQAAWAPDELGPEFDPKNFLPNDNVHQWKYNDGFSKRTLLGGFTPIANTGVWNPQYHCGYEATVVLPEDPDSHYMARVRVLVPDDQVTPGMRVYRDAQQRAFLDRYINCNAESFFKAVVGIWNQWHTFFESSMAVSIPDPWLLESARAGIMLSRCSYRGLRPTYQIGEGAYTKIPERSHALFPVAAYEFIWAHQLWNMIDSSDAYFQFYLDNYILPDGNFTYNTQDQVEAPLNVGLFLRNAARSYFYSRNPSPLRQSMPILVRMANYVIDRYNYTRQRYPAGDPHHGLIWGSPEADLGDPHNDFPDSHPFYYQNAANVWRGLHDYSLALSAASAGDPAMAAEATRLSAIAGFMRSDMEASLRLTLAAMSPQMKAARITPFTPEDIHRDPKQLLSYENHRFMQDWFLADWGDEALDAGHLRHRVLAGMQMMGLHIDGVEQRTSNFMAHGTLAVKIRQEDYRSYLLTLYALVCFTADCGNRYSPEDALIPGGYAGEGVKYWWSAVVNSVLQPALGLRWLLCYEDSDRDICHLQKAAPKHWFAPGERISVDKCPTRFGVIGWSTEAVEHHRWRVRLSQLPTIPCTLQISIHPADGTPVTHASIGTVQAGILVLEPKVYQGQSSLEIEVA
jgi:hypothetical protein